VGKNVAPDVGKGSRLGGAVRFVATSALEEPMEPKQDSKEGQIEGQASDSTSPVSPERGQNLTDGALALQPAAEPQVTREQRRSRRKRPIRAKTISIKRMTKRELELGRLLFPDVEDNGKPRTRAECSDLPRPCPYVSCQHHLYLDVSARTGAIKLNFPDLEVWEMTETCALDVADRGGTTLEEVGAIMNLTRERIRQVEVKGLARLAALRDMTALRDYVDEGPVGKRRLPVLSADDDEETGDDAEVDSDDDGDGRSAASPRPGQDLDVEFDVEAFASGDLDAE
jgi:hypothetical protein